MSSEELVRALGELAVSLRRRRDGSNAEKRALLKWLRSLSGEELASLCCVEDVGFVKTLLHMAARSRGSSGGVQEFQLLPRTVGGASGIQSKRAATKTPPRTAPREFVKRPVVRTVDGDVVGSFYSREYEESSRKLLRGMRVLNTLQSCDTVALSMEFFQPAEKKGAKFAEFFQLMEVISRGAFLIECPSEATLKHRVWGEVKWLKEQGYYSLQALFVNQIELNIWTSWKQRKKDTSTKIPLQGLASKLHLVREWEAANDIQKTAALKVLGDKTISHMRDLKQSVSTQVVSTTIFLEARSSLEALMDVLKVFQQSVSRGISVDVCFTSSFEDAITSPQATVIKLLLAEHLQEQCSLLLCENLSKEEELTAFTATAPLADGEKIADNGNTTKALNANHSQRRRASRKKMMKQRKRDSEFRAAQQTRFSSVLHELCEHFRRKQEEALACVDTVLRDVIDTAVDRSKLTPVAPIREDGDSTSSVADSDNESDFLYREGGFFDRQRAIKRRRRLWPFNYANVDDEEEIAEEHDARKEGRSSIYESPKHCFNSSTGKGDAWTECAHCCKCACHRAANARSKSEDSVEEREEADNDHNHASHCERGPTSAGSPVETEKPAASDTLAKITVVMERMTNLEEKLAEKTKAMDEQAANASSEITALNQTVAALTVQLHNVENDLQELRLQQMSVSANASGLDDTSMGNASSCSSSPAPFSPAPSSMEQQVDSPPTAALPLPETYATTNSVMGPFVSVPLSVLPPRSKLHWDLCEFAAQLQADSDARLPAQLAAQRLCMATVQSLWPRAQVRPYGSHVSRLVLPSSDVDLVICLPKVRRDAPADAAGVLEGRNAIKETWQQNLARKLRQEPWVVRDSVKTLPHAAVPIITLLTAPPYNVRLDISFEGPGHNGLATNDVVLSLLHEFPPLAPMMLVLKSFAIERGLAVAYSGGLSSYALLLLVARYLQEHSDTMPNGFANASRAVQHSLSTVQAGVADFGLMLMGFLDFYGNRFDPRTTGISVASRCFLNRESTFMAGMGDPHQVPHQYQQQYAADDAAVDDRTSQYGYAQHWQVPIQPHGPSLSPSAEAASAQGLRRYGYRSSLDLPASRALDGMGAATGLLDYQQLQQQTYDPHKFDPVFIEDPLCPSNNVGRNCFRIMQIRRAFSAAHLALLAASRDPAVFAENRMGLVAGVGLHPDNILRSILGSGAPVNAKPDAATSAAVGVTTYIGAIDHPYAFHPYTHHQQQQYAYHHHHHHQPPRQAYHPVGSHQPRTVSAYRNDPGSRRHSESESEKLTTRSATSTASHRDYTRKRHVGSPQLAPQLHGGDNHIDVQARLVRQSSTEYAYQPQRQSSLKQIHGQRSAKVLSRKNSERSMSLSLSFADVVRDGGGAAVVAPKTSPLAPARPPRFSRDDMALEESINERWETKDDSELK
ncbi:hypothetical protein PR001_g3948 [Phytophthora rubi]|uniref:Poly(A) RNA polymerase mitochondrial-like central palm domain-containing protein n=1 Tax=Phytophthora rubi TaxID=129364 RepID=A0A6A3NXW5_9STRA|nr:hypothetical protein PR001_g3948 [Phytophthora rubi]